MENDLPGKFTDFPLRRHKDKLKVGIIAGGISSEREVSLSTGKGIYEALLKSGYKADFIDFNGNVGILTEKIDIAFIALHGKFGEDGTVQGLMELLKVPYTGSGVLASAAAMDKIFTKKIFEFEQIPTPAFMPFEKKQIRQPVLIKPAVRDKIGYPVIVKPNRGGSSIGVTIVHEEKMLNEAAVIAFEQDNKILIEKFIKGRLLTVAIIGADPVCLPIVEIKPKSGFYDYESKYTPGMTEYIVPASLDIETAAKIKETALKCHNALCCEGISRVDLILFEDKMINIIEVNTIPGMTPTSLVPKAAAASGICFEYLVEIILNSASLKI